MTIDEIRDTRRRARARLIDAIANLQHAQLEAGAIGDGCIGGACRDAIKHAERAMLMAGAEG